MFFLWYDSSMKKSFKRIQAGLAPIVIILVVAAALAVAGGGWWWYTKNVQCWDCYGFMPPESSSTLQQAANGSTSLTTGWKTYNTKQFAFSYPPTATISTEGERVIVTKSGIRYAELAVACSPDPGNSSKIYSDYSIFDQQKFANSLGSYFNNYQDFFAYRNPIATISASKGKLFVFKGGEYCDAGSCTGDPNRLFAVACASGQNKNGHMALQCFTALSSSLNEAEQGEFINNFLSSIRLLDEFTSPSSCIGVGETKG